jgi:isopentenyl diphosphate isomerase/L-lactate dehydrogenase-like FMN-dependent dehydrogenase
MDAKLNRRFPDIAEIEKIALKRLPRFLADYMRCGMGNSQSVYRNREALEAVTLLPYYSRNIMAAETAVKLFDKTWQAPFGIAPVGLGSFAWPGASDALAAEAQNHGIPFCAPTFSLASLEQLRLAAGDCGWFQLYRPNLPEVEVDILKRALDAGYQTLMVTVDIPTQMRRAHDIRSGFTIPPQFDFNSICQMLTHPRWSAAQAWHCINHGIPGFDNLNRYIPADMSINQAMQYRSDMILGYISEEVICSLRDAWPGTLIVKGVLSVADAVAYKACGVDGILISNHGGRQLEAAPATIDQLPLIRAAVGESFPLLVDGGVRSGIDICRMLARGADFVMLGRPVYYAMAAMGRPGAAHVIELLIEEFRCAMGQLGCENIAELRGHLNA